MRPKLRGLRLLTVNVNGMGSPKKAAALLQYVVSICGNPDIICVQELKLHTPSILETLLACGGGPGLPYKCISYVSIGTSHSRGVAVLMSERCHASLTGDVTHARDSDGRIVRVDFAVQGKALSVLSVYAPNTGQAAFFHQLQAFLPLDRLCFVGGDFNCIAHQDDQTSTGTSRMSGAASLISAMDGAGLVDAYRQLHPSGREFTHVCTSGQSSARLDRWLVPETCIPWGMRVSHEWGAPGDHAGVLLHVAMPDMPSLGRGICSFPLHVLYDPPLLSKLKEGLQAHLSALLASPGPGSNWGRWVVLKEFVLTAGRQISMTHRRQQRQRIQAALQKVQDEVKALSSHTAQTAALTELQSAVAELKEEVWSQASRVAFAASAMWRDHGERTTAWHFAQAGKIQNRSPIKSLLQHDGTRVDMSSVQSGLDLHGLVSEHFSGACPDGLFAERPTVGAAQDRLLFGLPFLSSMQALKAEGPSGDGSITQQCLSTALSSSRLGAAPGRDGLPYEVFKVL